MSFFLVFNQILVLFILLIVGFFIRKINIVDNKFSKSLSNFLFNIVMPAMIIDSMNYPFSIETLVDSGKLIALSFIILAVSAIISIIVVKLLKIDKLSRNILQFGIIFSNFAFMGFPVVETLFGKDGRFYASVFNIPIFLVVNSLGIMLIKRGDEKAEKMELGNVINAPVIAVVVGFLSFLFSFKFPAPVQSAMSMLAVSITPLSMILVGMLLAELKISAVFLNYKVYIISIIRLVVLPITLLYILKSFNLDEYMIGIPVIITAMPVAVNASIVAEKYDSNPQLAAQLIFISTLLSILTIPLIAYLL